MKLSCLFEERLNGYLAYIVISGEYPEKLEVYKSYSEAIKRTHQKPYTYWGSNENNMIVNIKDDDIFYVVYEDHSDEYMSDIYWICFAKTRSTLQLKLKEMADEGLLELSSLNNSTTILSDTRLKIAEVR